MVNWSVFFFREWTHPDLKEHTESNMRVTLGTEQAIKKKQLCSYYGHQFLKALREYSVGCQKGHDLSRTFGTKFHSPFLWLQRPYTSLHSLEMELLCNIQKDQRETFEIPLPTCLAIPLGKKKSILETEKANKINIKRLFIFDCNCSIYWLPKLPKLPALC